MVKFFHCAAVCAIIAFSLGLGGCGYTTKANLPEGIQRVYVAPVQNEIDLTTEIVEKGRYRTYRAGLEVDIMNAIINRFIFDGTLKVGREHDSDAILRAKVIEYFRDPLRYTGGDDVQEYRLNVVIDAEFVRAGTGQIIWQSRMTGDSTYFLSGPRAVSEDEALNKAVEDLARRVVEKTIELW